MVELHLICQAAFPHHAFVKTWTMPKDEAGVQQAWREISAWLKEPDPRCEHHPDYSTQPTVIP